MASTTTMNGVVTMPRTPYCASLNRWNAASHCGVTASVTTRHSGPGWAFERTAAPDGGDRPALPAIIVLTAYDYPQYAEAALSLGAAGFVSKTAPVGELVDAIRRVAAGGLAFTMRPRMVGRIHLTAREHDVVRLVADGQSNDEIGATLGIGSKTVETHLSRIFERFGVSSRTELAARAVREGWLDIPPAS